MVRDDRRANGRRLLRCAERIGAVSICDQNAVDEWGPRQNACWPLSTSWLNFAALMKSGFSLTALIESARSNASCSLIEPTEKTF